MIWIDVLCLLLGFGMSYALCVNRALVVFERFCRLLDLEPKDFHLRVGLGFGLAYLYLFVLAVHAFFWRDLGTGIAAGLMVGSLVLAVVMTGVAQGVVHLEETARMQKSRKQKSPASDSNESSR